MPKFAPDDEQTLKGKVLSVTVPPNGMAKLILGTYPTKEAVPVFSYDSIPDRHEFISADEKVIGTDSGVLAVVHFQNYGDTETLVTAQPLIGQ